VIQLANLRVLSHALALQILLAINVFGSIHVAKAQSVNIPNFWDPQTRVARPDFKNLPRLKFLTTTDFPPFNFIDRKQRLSGFHVELARAICEELDVLDRCQIQAVPFEELVPSLEKKEGEALLAGLEITEQIRKKLDFSRPYMEIPGRFLARRDSGITAPIYEGLRRKKTGLVASSNHAVFFERAFENRDVVQYPSRERLLAALARNEVQVVFSDALSLSFWLASEVANDCCQFVDGPFRSAAYLSNGMAVAVSRGNDDLRDAMDYALFQINQSGKFQELYLRYFPVSLY